MAKILGIGGVFVKCPKNGPDTDSYNAWWKTHMGGCAVRMGQYGMEKRWASRYIAQLVQI